MAQVRVAKARIALGLGFTSGMKVSYIVTDASQRPMRVLNPGWRMKKMAVFPRMMVSFTQKGLPLH